MDKDELHAKVTLLKEELEAGRVKLRSLGAIESLKQVRMGPDGKIDPDTVDGRVRALANAVAFSRYHKDLKQIPLRDVQSTYFEILDRFFGRPFAEMKKHGVSPPEIARNLVSNEKLVKAFESEGSEFVSCIRDFWDSYGPVVEAHLEDLRALKSVYGGDMFPSYQANIACSVGLYMDTIVLPDPLMSLGDFVGMMATKELLFFIAKHALNALTYRELALAEVEPPIVVIAPQYSLTNESYRTALEVAGEADVVEHAGKLFGRTFSNSDDIKSFLRQFSSADQLVSGIADSRRLLFDTEWSEPLVEQIHRHATELSSKFQENLAKASTGDVVWMALIGRMMQVNDEVFRSSQYGGTPLIDAPTSWQYLLWKYEYDINRSAQLHDGARDVLISRALEAQGKDQLGIISGIPPATLIELRQQGALAELRETIRRGIADIDSASATNLADVADAVWANLDTAFSEHKREVEELSSSRHKFFGLDVGSWVAVGSISIAAASTGNVPLSVIAASLATAGAPSAKDLWKRWQELQRKGEGLKRSPTGILFRHRK